MKHYLVVGGGTAGWISAAILSNLFKYSDTKVSLIESPNVPTIGVGEATIPSILDLLDYLNISKEEFIVETNATFKLAIKFIDWLQLDHHYWHPFGQVGGKIDTLDFYHHWRKYSEKGGSGEFTDFSPAVALAKEGKFYVSNPSKADLFSSSDYALHFDAVKVANFLKKYSINNGVKHINANVESVNKTKCGDLESVVLDNGQLLSADFFIDCTGQAALLIGQSLGVDYLDWRKFLPVDRAVAVQSENTGVIHPYTISQACKHGWRWKIPLQARTGNGYVYSSEFCSDDEATTLLLSKVAGRAVNEPRVIHFLTGKRDKFWHKNCLAVGLSSGFLEPLESTSIYLIMKAMLNFVQMLPTENIYQPTVDEFNRLMNIEFECIRDFIVLHYCTSKRIDSPFWLWWKNTKIPDSLGAKIRLFRAQGRLMKNELDLFSLDSWYSVLEGMQVRPFGYDPICRLSNSEKVDQMLKQRLAELKESAAKMPTHEDFFQLVNNKQIHLPRRYTLKSR